MATSCQRVSGARISALQDLRDLGESLAGLELDGGVDLSGVDLSKAGLEGATLSGANLEFTTLSGATLSSAVLFGADLGISDLSNAVLSNANLRGACLFGVKNLTNQQIKSAFGWEEAIYTEADYGNGRIWIAKDEQANQAKIKEIEEGDPEATIHWP